MPKLVKRSTNFAVEYFDKAKGFTTRQSLGTDDPGVAERLFGEWLISNTSLSGEDPWALQLDYVVALFYEQEAKNFPSHYVYKSAKDKVVLYLGQKGSVYPKCTVRDFKPSVQRKLVSALFSEGLTPATVNRLMGAISSSIGRAFEDEAVRPKVISVPVPQSKKQLLSDEALRTLLKAPVSERAKRYITLALLTGARPGALMRLSKAQFDFDHRLIDLLPPGEAQIRKKYKPCIPMPKCVESIAKTWDDGFVFQADHGKPLSSNEVIWDEIVKYVPLGITPYSFRRTCAAEMRRQGVPFGDIAGYLGHKVRDARVTELYAQYDPSFMRTAADAMDRFWERLTGVAVENRTDESGDGAIRERGRATEDSRESALLD